MLWFVELKYQRTVIGYHGCDESIMNGVLIRGKKLKTSNNDYDWLGRGIYFWEHGPNRAHEWAKKAKQIKKPCVLGALINLGNCFDLLDTSHTELLSGLFPIYKKTCDEQGIDVPKNSSASREDSGDFLIRRLDCAVINWCLDFLENEENQYFHTVRCLFSEGRPAFDGSKIFTKSHIQIAVRDDSAIIGYFKPELTT